MDVPGQSFVSPTDPLGQRSFGQAAILPASEDSSMRISQLVQEILSLQGVLRERRQDAALTTGRFNHYRQELSVLVESSDSTQEPNVLFMTTLARHVLEMSGDQEKWLSEPLHVEANHSIPDTPITEKLFTHIHGDFFAKDSGHEGEALGVPVSYLLTMLPKLRARGDSGISDTAIAGILQTLESAQGAVAKVNNPSDLANAIRYDLSHYGFAMIPGGWCGTPGHAMWYEVVQEKDGSHSFKAYNRGSGVEYHAPPSLRQGKLYYPAYYERKNINLDKLLNEGFLGLLMEPQGYKGDSTPTGDPQYRAGDLYEVLFPKLGGTLQPKKLEMEELMSLQKSGTCAWKSLMAVIRQHLTPQEHKLLMYAVHKESLWSFYVSNQDRITTAPTCRHLFEKALHNQADILDSLHKAGVIGSSAYERDVIELFKLAQAFTSRKKLVLQEVRAKMQSISTEPFQNSETIGNWFLRAPPRYFNTAHVTPGLPVVAPFIAEWTPTTERLVEDLRYFMGHLQELRQTSQHSSVLRSVYLIQKKLPLPQVGQPDVFWANIIRDNPVEALSLLADLHHVAMESTLFYNSMALPQPTCILAFFKLTALSHHIIAEADPDVTELKGLQVVPDMNQLHHLLGSECLTEGTQSIRRTRTTRFQLPNAEDAQELRQIQNYFLMRYRQKDAPEPSAFPLVWNAGQAELKSDYFTLLDLNRGAVSAQVRYLRRMAERPDIRASLEIAVPNGDELEKIAHLYNHAEELLPATYVRWRKQVSELQGYLSHQKLKYGSNDRSMVEFNGSVAHPNDEPSVCFLKPEMKCLDLDPWDRDPALQLGIQQRKDEWKGMHYSPHLISIDALDISDVIDFQDRYVYAGAMTLPEMGKRLYQTARWFWNIQYETYGYQIERAIHNWIATSEKTSVLPNGQEYLAPYNKLSNKELRELLLIGVNEEIQVSQLLAYFMRHPERLASHEYQAYFSLQLFDRDLLIRQLQRHPRFLLQLRQFIHTQLKIAEDKGDVITASFLLEVDQRIEQHWNVATADWTDAKRVAWNQEIKETSGGRKIRWHLRHQRLLKVAGLSPLEKSVVNARMIASFKGQKKLRSTAVEAITKGVCHLKKYPLYGLYEDPLLVYRMQASLADLMPLLSQELSLTGNHSAWKKQRNQDILNNLYQSISGFDDRWEWRSDGFPLFIADNGQVIMNLMTGEVRTGSVCHSGLPDFILSNSRFNKIFKQVPRTVSFLADLNGVTYEFTDAEGRLNRIQQTIKTHHPTFLREINGVWYRYTEFQQGDKGFQSDLIRNHCQYWVSEDRKKIIAFPEGRRESYLISTDARADDSYSIQEVTLLNADGTPSDRHLIDLTAEGCPYNSLVLDAAPDARHYLDQLSNPIPPFDPGQVQVWATSDHQPVHIEVPAMQLDFDLKMVAGVKRWECRQVMGFYLDQDPYVGMLEQAHVRNYLKLVNKRGEERVLIPKAVPATSAEKGIGLGLRGQLPLEPNPTQFIQLTVIKNAGQGSTRLHGDPEALFYLAFRMMGGADEEGYAGAREILQEINLRQLKGKREELEILQWIALLGINNADNDPRAVALRLKARLLADEMKRRAAREGTPLPTRLAKDASSDEAMAKKDFEAFQADIEAYASVISHYPTYKLTKREETDLLELAKDRNIPVIAGAYAYFQESLGTETMRSLNFVESGFGSELQHPYEVKVLANAGDFTEALVELLDEANDPASASDSRGKQRLRLGAKGAAELFVQHTKNLDLEALKRTLELARFDPNPISQIVRATLTLMVNTRVLLPSSNALPALHEYGRPQDRALKAARKTKWRSLIENRVLPACAIMAGIEKIKPNTVSTTLEQRNEDTNAGRLRSSAVPGRGEKSHFPTGMHYQEAMVDPEIPPPPIFDIQSYCVASSEEASSSPRTDARLHTVASACRDLLDGTAVHGAEGEAKRLKGGIDDLVITKTSRLPQQQINPEQVVTLTEDLARHTHYQRTQLAVQEAELLAAVTSLDAVSVVQRLKGSQEPVTIDDICLRLATNQIKDNNVKTKAIAYLELATQIQQHERTLDLINTWKKSAEKVGNEEMRAELLSQVLASESAKRVFNPIQRPEMLVLEYLSNLLIRQDQYQNFQLLLEGKHAGNPVIQAIMGSGKTSVLMTLLALCKCNGDNLSVVLLPQELLESMSEDIRIRLGTHWRQMVHPLPISRDSDFSVTELQKIRNQLERIRIEKHCLLMSPKSMHCLYLKYQEIIRDTAEAKERGEDVSVQLQQIALMREILGIFKSKGTALLDEVDLQLNSRTEVNFPLGEFTSFSPEDAEVTLELYDILLQQPNIRELLKLDFDPAKPVPGSRLFNEASYHAEVKPILAQELLERLSNPVTLERLLPNCSDNLAAILQDNASLQHLFNYLVRVENIEARRAAHRFVDAISDKDLRNLLALSKEEINVLFPLTLKKKCTDQYNIDLERNHKIATSYRNGRPVRGSRFANPHETANFTVQALLHNGIPTSQISTVIKALKSQAEQEFKETGDLKATSAYTTYCLLCDKPDVYHLLRMNDNTIAELAQRLNDTPRLRRNFISMFILPDIIFHPQKLNSNGQNLANFFDEVTAFSGTLWNADTYHKRLSPKQNAETDATTIFLLMNKVTKVDKEGVVTLENHVTEVPNEHPDTLRAVVYGRLRKGHPSKVVLDAGGYLNDVDISALTQTWSSLLHAVDPTIDGIAYHNDSNALVMQEISKQGLGEPISFERSSLKPEKRFTIYRQPFTTGTDIKQSDNAEAVVTIGRNILMRDLSQTVWRMRKIDRNQSVHFVVSKDVADVIRTTLILPQKHPISDGDIIRFAIVNEALQLQEDNYVATGQQMLEVIQRAVMDILMDPNIPPDVVVRLYNSQVQSIFCQKTAKEAYELYGRLQEEVAMNEAIESLLKHNRELLQAIIESDPILKDRLDPEAIDVEMQKCVDLNKLKKTAFQPSESSEGQLVEEVQETNAVKEKESLKETLKETVEESERASIKPWTYHEWRSRFTGTWMDRFADFFIGRAPASSHQRNMESGMQRFYTEAAKRFRPFKGINLGPIVGPVIHDIKQKIGIKLHEWLGVEGVSDPANALAELPKRLISGPPYSYNIREYFGKNPAAKPFVDHLYAMSYVTSNFAPPIAYTLGGHVAKPFDDFEKPCQSVLVLLNPKTKVFQLVAGDNADTETFTKQLAEEKFAGVPDPEGRIALIYNLNSGINQIGKPTLSDVEVETLLRQDPLFTQATAQIKLLTGHSLFTDDEKLLLRLWIEEIGVEEARTAYHNTVLANMQEGKSELWIAVKGLFS